MILALLSGGGLLALTFSTALWNSSRAVDLAHLACLVMGIAAMILLTSRGEAHDHIIPRLLSRISVAAALNLLYWVTVIEPHFFEPQHPRFLLLRFLSLIDLPVAAFALLLPKMFRECAVDVHMQSFPYGITRFCFGVPPGMLWRHLTIAIPVWVALLSIPDLVRHFARRRM